MKKMNRILALGFVLAVVCVFADSGPAQAAVLYAGNYSQDFNSLGTTGTTGITLPTGWSIWNDNGGGPATPSLTSSQVQGMVSPVSQVAATSGIIIDTNITNSITTNTKTATQWFNIGSSSTSGNSGGTNDRVISTSPTTNAGSAFQLALTNNTGSALNQIVLSYDIVKFHNGWDRADVSGFENETAPGYQLYYSIGSSTSWTNVIALNPTSTQIPGGTPSGATQGQNLGLSYFVYSILNAPVSLDSSWIAGDELRLRWVDDNAVGITPDQIIGLNNVQVVPIPAAAWLLGTGLVGLVALRRRKSSRDRGSASRG